MRGYDDTKLLYTTSVERVTGDHDARGLVNSIVGEPNIDLCAIYGYRIGSLKELACKLAFDRIQELPYPFDAELTPAQMHEAAADNWRDLEITATLDKLVEDVIVGRLALRLAYGLPVIVDKSDQGVAELLPAHTLFGDGKRIYTNAR